MEGHRTLSQLTGLSMQIRFWTLIFSPQLHLSGPIVTRPHENCEDRREAHPGFKEKPKATPGSPLCPPAWAGHRTERSGSAQVVVRRCGISWVYHHTPVLIQFWLQEEFSTGVTSCENEWEVHEYPFILTHFSCDLCPVEQNLTATIC